MQSSENNYEIDPLTPEEIEAAWQEAFLEIDKNILLIIRKMGFKRSLARLIEELVSAGQYVPTCDQLKLALIDDLDLHARIFERVYKDFRKAVTKAKVDRNHVGGWLNRTTRRKTWKLAMPRARELLYELQPYTEGTDELANIGNSEWSPDELLMLREFTERYAEVVASLSIRERRLFDAKIAGKGYADLAVAYHATTNAIKAEVSRLCQRIVRLVRGDDDGKTTTKGEKGDI